MSKIKVILAVIFGISFMSGAIAAQFDLTNHYDGEQFFNPDHQEHFSIGKLVKWKWERTKPQWPEQVPIVPITPNPNLASSKVAVTFINHASFLIQIDDVNILTDPIWSDRTGPLWMGPKRVKEPGIKFTDLPPIDLVLVSHNHYDHLDLPTLKHLQEQHHPLIIAGLKTGQDNIRPHLQNDAKIRELDWWQSMEYKGVKITFVPAQHWSKRGLFDTNETLWGGFVISANDQHLYFSGDTGFGPHFAEIHKQFPNLNLCFLPIGAYKPTWFMKNMHNSPADSVQAHQILNCSTSIGMHFGTFQLADDEYGDPEKDLKKALSRVTPPLHFITLEHGQTSHF